MDFLNSALFFVIAIGLLVTVHEMGHFLVAKWLGIKVLRFSVGFGRPLWARSFGPDDTEYVVAAIPLGGYVKMLDEREGDVPDGERQRAFNRQSLGVRFAVVAAGPVFNFLFAVVAYAVMFVVGVTGLRPVVDSVAPDTLAAAAGLRAGQEIVAVEGRQTVTWERVVQILTTRALVGESVALEVEDERGARQILRFEADRLDLDAMSKSGFFDQFGVQPRRPRVDPVIGHVEAGSPADEAGLQPGDRVVGADGEAIESWSAWVDFVRARPEIPIEVSVERGGGRVSLMLTPARVESESGEIGRIGAGVEQRDLLGDPLYVVERFDILAALPKAAVKTWDISMLTLRMVWKMLTLQVSVENLSGPISIAQYAGDSAAVGIARFLEFLAIVSVSLGILNLLPIPLLDGGHLMYYLIELFRGRPVSEQAQLVGQRVGLALLIGLMGIAFVNDFVRLLG